MYKIIIMGLIISLTSSTEAAPEGEIAASGTAQISGVSINR